MKLIENIGCIILAIFSAASILIVKSFVVANQFTWKSYLICIIKLIIVWSVVIGGYFYLIFKNIAMAQFYPIIKIVELIIPVIVSILYYKAKLLPINYIGILLAFITIICIEWEKPK